MFSYSKLKQAQSYSDEQLLEHYRESGDLVYFGELFQRYTEMVFLVCRKYLGNDEDSKDSAMEIFEKLSRTLRSETVRNFRGWLYTVSKNHCLMKLRKADNITIVNLDVASLEGNFVENVENEHLEKESNFSFSTERLQEALTSLKGEQQKCIELFYFEKKRYKEIADITGFTLKQVKSYIQNGKKNLKSALSG